MAHLFISRLLETFFRRWWLYLLPIVPFLALGVVTVASAGDTYRSSGTILVDRSGALDQLQGLRSTGDNTFGFDTPAAYTARELSEYLQTEDFINRVINAADLRDDVDAGLLTEDEVRASVGAAAQGELLVSVAATNADPVVANRLAQATIDSFVGFRIEREANTSNVVANYLSTNELPAARDDAAAAQLELQRYTDASPLPTDPNIPQPADPEFERLSSELETAREEVARIQTAIDDNLRESAAKETEIRQRYSTFDKPQVPTAPEGSRIQDLQTLVLFGFLGFLVAAAALVVATLMDRSVRYGEEVEAHLHVPVVATLPDSKAALKPVGL